MQYQKNLKNLFNDDSCIERAKALGFHVVEIVKEKNDF